MLKCFSLLTKPFSKNLNFTAMYLGFVLVGGVGRTVFIFVIFVGTLIFCFFFLQEKEGELYDMELGDIVDEFVGQMRVIIFFSFLISFLIVLNDVFYLFFFFFF